MEAQIILRSIIEKAYAALNRLLVEIWVLRILLVRTQKEMENVTEKHKLLKRTGNYVHKQRRHHKTEQSIWQHQMSQSVWAAIKKNILLGGKQQKCTPHDSEG